MAKIDLGEFMINLNKVSNFPCDQLTRHNMVCRLICESLHAASCSIITYDGKIDKLRTCGIHMDSVRSRINYGNDGLLKLVLERINILRFLGYLGKPIIEKEAPEVIFERYVNSPFFSEDDSFDQVKITLQEYDKLHVEWTKFRKNIFNEDFDIRPHHLESKILDAGEIYYLHNQLESDTSIYAYELGRDSAFHSKLERNLSLIDLEVVAAGYLIGIPLLAAGRIYGVLRLVIPPDSLEEYFLFDHDRSIDFQTHIRSYLVSVAHVVSLDLETHYLVNGYKDLSKIIDPDLLNPQDLSQVCNDAAKFVNCWGAVARLYDEDERDSVIVGVSDNLTKYESSLKTVEGISKAEKNGFNKQIQLFFERNQEYICLTFKTIPHEYPSVSAIAYRHNPDTGELENSTIEIEVQEFNVPEYRRLLEGLRIAEIAVFPIPLIRSSYVSFCNTKQRKFVRTDIEMLSSAVRNIGLEIKRYTDRKVLKQFVQVHAMNEISRSIFHQFAAPLSSLVIQIEEFNRSKMKFPKPLQNIEGLAKQASRKVRRYQRMLEMETDEIKPHWERIERMGGYLSRIADDYKVLTKEGIQIGVFTMYGNQATIPFYTDLDLFSDIIHTFLDNAVKYSFSESKLARESVSINFDPTDYRSDGHIHLEYRVDPEKTYVEISSWGAKIDPTELNEIFEKNVRGKNANFTSRDGTGLGLYIVKTLVKLLNGKVGVKTENHKSTFFVEFFTKKI